MNIYAGKVKKDVIIYIFIILLSLVVCQNYLKNHYAVDTYDIINTGYTNYAINNFLAAGRPFSCLLLLLADIMNFPIQTVVFISSIVAILISGMSVMLIRKIILKLKGPKNVLQEIIIVCISYCTIFNFMYIEPLHFLESSILSLSIYLAILAAYELVYADKYRIVKSFICMLFSIFSYNGAMGVYILTILLLLLVDRKNNKKNISKNIIISGIICVICIIFNFIQIKIVSNCIGITEQRVLKDINIFYNMKYIITHVIDMLAGKTTQLFPQYLFLIFLSCIVGIAIYYFHKEKQLFTIRFLVVTCIGILISFGIHIFSLSSFGAGRLHMTLGMTIGYCFIMLYVSTTIFETKKFLSYMIELILFIYLISNMINFYTKTEELLEVNQIDQQQVKEIAEYIESYEKENNIEVKYITMKHIPKKIEKGHYKRVNCLTSIAVYSECSYDAVINFYANLNLKRITLTKEIEQKYTKSTEGDYKALCVDNILVCPIYND